MNIKELAQKESRIVSGHRACAGCGFPQIVRTILASTDKKVVVANATGCLEVVSTIYPYSAWTVPYIHSAFENAASTISGIESAYKVLKKKGKFSEDIKFLGIAGDGGGTDIGLQALSGMLERGHDVVFVHYDNNAYENCLTLDTLVLTESGLKLITEVKKGEKIYAFDQERYDLVLKKCNGVFDNGKKRIYEVSTLHHNIKATGNHPFLILKHNGRKKQCEFIWKTLEEIRKGDEIVVLSNLYDGKSYTFDKFKFSKKGDYKVNKINSVIIPKKSNKDLMKFLGIYVGDGWYRLNKAEIGFSAPENNKARKPLLKLIKNLFQTDALYLTKNEVHIRSVNIARFIESLGFGKGSKKKILPPWVFTLPREEKEAFLDGLMLSDGTKMGESWRYPSASKELVRRLRLLLQTVGYSVGKIHHIKIKKGKHVVYRPLLKDTEYWYICFSRKKKWNIKKYPSQYKYYNFLVENKHFDVERVIDVKRLGMESTLDLRVTGEHNFLANGLVVHNTGVQRSGATPFSAATSTTPVGSKHKGKEIFKKDIMKIVIAHDIPYAAQASLSDLDDLSEKAKKAFEVKGPAFINVLQPCTLGWKFSTNLTVEIAKKAVDSCFWPLYEVVNGKYKLNYKPENKIPVLDYVKLQGRFKHLLKEKEILTRLQKHVDLEWEKLLKFCEEKTI